MNTLSTLFLNNEALDAEIAAFCAEDPEFISTEQTFYDTAHKIAQIAGFDLYDEFEQKLGRYLARAFDIYYLFGLGLRQEIISALEQN